MLRVLDSMPDCCRSSKYDGVLTQHVTIHDAKLQVIWGINVKVSFLAWQGARETNVKPTMGVRSRKK